LELEVDVSAVLGYTASGQFRSHEFAVRGRYYTKRHLQCSTGGVDL
jgi:hypothetical protein